jgi:hypothetical protein
MALKIFMCCAEILNEPFLIVICRMAYKNADILQATPACKVS